MARGVRPFLALIAFALVLAATIAASHVAAQASSPPPEAKEGGEKKGEGKLPKNILEFDSLTVNLAEPRSYARLSFYIEFKTDADAEGFNMAKARDAVIFLLTRKKKEDLWTGKDKANLKFEIINRFNDFLGSRKVAKIHFIEFIVY